MKFEVKIRFQGLNPHPVFQVAKLEQKIAPAPFIVTYVDFNRDSKLPDLTAKSCFTTLIQASKTLHHSNTYVHKILTNDILHPFCNILYSQTIPIELTDTDNYLPQDDLDITNLMVSHYDCEKKHNLTKFNLINVKPCTEAPSNIQHAKVRARVYVRAKAEGVKAFKCEAYAKKERKISFQDSVKY